MFYKNVSLLLALFSAVRENNFERRLQVECEIVKYCFAFNHINYACYVSYQQFVCENYKVSIVMRWWILRKVVLVAHFQVIHFPACTVILKKKYSTDKQKGRQVPTVQDLIQTSPKLPHGLLHLISIQSYAKSFGENTIKYKHKS